MTILSILIPSPGLAAVIKEKEKDEVELLIAN